MRNENYGGAEKLLIQYGTEESKDVEALTLLGYVQSSLGKFEESERQLSRALSINPGYEKALYYSALNAFLAGDYERAIERFKEVTSNSESYMYIGLSYANLSRVEMLSDSDYVEMKKAFSEYFSLRPDSSHKSDIETMLEFMERIRKQKDR